MALLYDRSTMTISSGWWEWGGTFDGVPALSDRVAQAASFGGVTPPGGCSVIQQLKCAPGDIYGGSTGYRTLGRKTNPLVTYQAPRESWYVWGFLLPSGYPADASMYLTGMEIHQTDPGGGTGVAPMGFTHYGNRMRARVWGGATNGTGGIGNPGHSVLIDHEWTTSEVPHVADKDVWHIIAMRYKLGGTAGVFELWHGVEGVDGSVVSLTGTLTGATTYGTLDNYEAFGIYRNQTGASTTVIYTAGWREYSTQSEALAWANTMLGGSGGGIPPEPPPDVPPPVPGDGDPGSGEVVGGGGNPTTHALADAPESAVRFPCGSKWRFIVADLEGETVTLLDGLATERVVTPKLNEPLEVSFTVPSDHPEINTLHTDGFPFLAEGVRQLFCFRRESDSSPYYTIRASALILQTTDAGDANPARTSVTAWDPWQYMMFRPVLVSSQSSDPDGTGAGSLIGDEPIEYPALMPANLIALDMIQTTIGYADPAAPDAAQACFIDWSGGDIETCQSFADPYPIQQGTSLGQALQDLCSTGLMDIVLSPIYDPIGQPGVLCALNIYNQWEALGAGDYRYGAVFAWDRPSRSILAISAQVDGTLRANAIQYFNGQGGPPVPLERDPVSIARYGEYNVQQFFPAQIQPAGVIGNAQLQLEFRSRFKETVTVNPVPERAPQPFVDYYLGDRVPIYASNKLRWPLPPGTIPPTVPPTTSPEVFQRVYGIPIEIDDNGVETVRELIVGPVGMPPGEAPSRAGSGSTAASSTTAVETVQIVSRTSTTTADVFRRRQRDTVEVGP